MKNFCGYKELIDVVFKIFEMPFSFKKRKALKLKTKIFVSNAVNKKSEIALFQY